MKTNFPFKSRYQKRQSQRNAAAIVELAFVLPLLFTLLFATIEACAMLHLQQTLEIAAYESARISLVPTSKTSLVQETADRFFKNRKVQGGTVTITPSNFETSPIGTIITVRAAAPATGNLPLPPMFFSGLSLSASCSMMKEYE
ncbi:MAG: TadE/TadG family type IV pilus assembly protein [Pirellula sp.]